MRFKEPLFQSAILKYYVSRKFDAELSSRSKQYLHKTISNDLDFANYATCPIKTELFVGEKRYFPDLDPARFNKIVEYFTQRLSLLMIAVKELDHEFANFLLDYGASVGAHDANGNTVIDHISKELDVHLIARLTLQFAERDPRGLIVGCGFSVISPCAIPDTIDYIMCNHNHIHPCENFITIDKNKLVGPDLAISFSEIENDKSWLSKHTNHFKIIIFEYVDFDSLYIDSITSQSTVLDLAYRLLTDDGFCILGMGQGENNDLDLVSLAQISGFGYGTYFPDDRTGIKLLTVSKQATEIVIEPWMRSGCQYMLYPNFQASLQNHIEILQATNSESQYWLDFIATLKEHGPEAIFGAMDIDTFNELKAILSSRGIEVDFARSANELVLEPRVPDRIQVFKLKTSAI